MLAPAISAVDDGHAGPFGCLVRRALLEMAHGDNVAVVFKHKDCILDGLLIEVTGARHPGIGEAHHMSAQAMHGRFSAKTGARAGLIEGSHQRLVAEQIAIAPVTCIRFQVFSNLKDTHVIVALEILQ